MFKEHQKSNFGNFVFKLLAFFMLIYVLDFLIGSQLKKYYFRQKAGYNYQTTYSIDSAQADIMIFGSSRAANILNPEIFEEHYNLSCFNVGRLGYPLFYHYAVLKAVLKRRTPKIAILSFDASNFSVKQDPYDRISSLLPYYKNHPEIRPIVELKGPYEKLKMLSAMYPYNSAILPIISGNSAFAQTKFATIKGFMPLKRTITQPFLNFDYTTEKTLDSVKIRTYKDFIQECIDSSIRLYIICPPYMLNTKGIDSSITVGKKIARQYHINFFDYTQDTTFINHPNLFADFRHLNEGGTQIFARDLIHKIDSVSKQIAKAK